MPIKRVLIRIDMFKLGRENAFIGKAITVIATREWDLGSLLASLQR